MKPERLYGLVDAEELYEDIAGVYESQIEPWYDEDHTEPIIVEEWTVADTIQHLPSVDMVTDYIYESTADADVGEGWAEEASKHVSDPEFLAALQIALNLYASKIDYYMADKKVATHTVRINGGQPTLDGDPMYVPAIVKYRRTAIAEMSSWYPGHDMTGVSISEPDLKAGSPKKGDKIARNPENHEDKWLVAEAYFKANFEEMGEA